MHDYSSCVNTIPVGVLGASGYAGRELCALIARHPGLDLAFATANEQRGSVLRLGGRPTTLVGTDEAPLGDAALVFSALPHGASGEWVARARAAGARVVDLSNDLRIGNGTDDVPYGMPELNRWGIAEAPIVANPGCYPTAILLALAPFLKAGLVAPGACVDVVAASGVSGAGNSPKRELLFAEVSDDYRAYGVGNEHRHLNEMRAAVRTLGGDVDLLFTPHLLPVARGILATITLPLTRALDDPMGPWRAAYAHEPFIELADAPPTLREVAHRNVVRLHAVTPSHLRTPTVLLFAAIDNLVKGAAGQALQNANIMLGLDETAGLPA